MAIIEFWKKNTNPISGFKIEKAIYNKVPKKKQLLEIDSNKYLIFLDSIEFYKYKVSELKAFCRNNEILDFFVYFNKKKYVDREVLEMFLKTPKEDFSKPKPKAAPDGYVILSRLARDKNVIYSTFYSRIIKHNVPKTTIRNVLYILESEALKHI